MKMNLAEWSRALSELSRRGGYRVVAVQSGRHQASGWIWDATHVVTVEHVLSPRSETLVSTPQNPRLAAQIVGTCPGLDLALLRLESEVEVVATPSRSADRIHPGELALALARSAADGLGVSAGVIACRSGPWTSCRGGRAEHFLQPDLQLYPGYSGGPLIDAEGNWLGINTRGLSRQQPITLTTEAVDQVVQQILQGGHEPAYLGVGLQTVQLPSDWAERWGVESGAMAISLETNSPAAQGGVLLGDILIELAGVATGGTPDVIQELQRLQVGQATPSRWIRAGEEIQLEIELGRRPAGGGCE
jgi:S1-C subfamily serine protease